MKKLPPHTPEPWVTQAMPATEDTRHWVVGGYSAKDHRPVMIATFYPIDDDGQPGGECEANVRLAIAAPKLLAALRECELFVRMLALDTNSEPAKQASKHAQDIISHATATSPL